MAFTQYVVDCDMYTFEEALVKMRQACESTSYPVHLSYNKGEFTLIYQKPVFPDVIDEHAQNITKL